MQFCTIVFLLLLGVIPKLTQTAPNVKDYPVIFFIAESTGGLTVLERQMILNAHNHFRREVANGRYAGQPKAAGMPLLRWDDRLAFMALNWTKYLRTVDEFHHSDNNEKLSWPGIGENLLRLGSRTKDFKQSLERWFEEGNHYNFTTQTCDKDPSRNKAKTCGHYIQGVQAKSLYVGCQAQVHRKSKNFLLACNYGPGTYKGKPYEAGEPCSKCEADAPWCIDGMCATKEICDRSENCKCKKKCTNGAEIDPNTCYCTKKCPSGQFCTVRRVWKTVPEVVNIFKFEVTPSKNSDTCTDSVGTPNFCGQDDIRSLCYRQSIPYAITCPKTCNACFSVAMKMNWISRDKCMEFKKRGFCKQMFGKRVCGTTCG